MPNIPHNFNVQNFMDSLDRSGPQGSCWPWMYGIHHSGYGVTYINGKQWQAHRVAYCVFLGAIPDGMLVCHQCDNKRCCNPAHLFLGDQNANMSDCAQKGRTNKPFGESHSSAKLSETDVREILRLYHLEKWRIADIHRRFGVTRGAIDGIIFKRNWTRVKDDWRRMNLTD